VAEGINAAAVQIRFRIIGLSTGALLLTGAVLALACSGPSGEPGPTATPETFAPRPTEPPSPTPSGPTPVPADEIAEQDADPALPGVYYPPHPGADGIYGSDDDRGHVPPGTVIPICSPTQLASGLFYAPLCYPSNPPTSGPHASFYPQLGVQTNAVPKEQLVHSMEHSAVIIWVNTANEALWRELTTIVQDLIAQRKLVVMSRYAEMEPETIALTGWTRLDKFPVSEYTQKRVVDFVLVHERRFNPEGF
jgi:hypothetical protein